MNPRHVIMQRIPARTGVEGIPELLACRLTPTDLKSSLVAVYHDLASHGILRAAG